MSDRKRWGNRDGIWPTSMQQLLLRAALVPDERALDAWRQLRPQLELAMADPSAQLVMPALYRNLLALDVADESMPLLKGTRRFTWARNQVLLHHTLPAVGALGRAGIPTMLLKGAALVADARSDAGLRAMNDIDVLVPTHQARAAIDVLVGCGLAPVAGVPPWYVADYAPRFSPSYGFTDGADCELDLHWHALHASCQPDADDDFWAAAVDVEVLAQPMRALCPADELLLVVLHGLRWDEHPTYRWVVDATLLARGTFGTVDFDRLVQQAGRRRVVAPLRAGLTYLRQVLDVPVPASTMGSLRSARPRLVERLEFRALLTQPRARSRLARRTVLYQQHVRRELALGEPPTLRRQLALARGHLGLDRLSELRQWPLGEAAGPGHPACATAAAIGTGEVAEAAAPLRAGETLDFARADVARNYVAYGAWCPEEGGCWLAGLEARIVLPLASPAATSLMLGLSAGGFLSPRRGRQRLDVLVNGRRVARLRIDAANPRLCDYGVLVPFEAVAGCTRIELTLRTPDAASAARLGFGDEQREFGVFLRQLVVREPRRLAVGDALTFGAGSGDESMLAGGWSEPAAGGRWTLGHAACLLLRAESTVRDLQLECEARPFLGGRKGPLRVDVSANGRRLTPVRYHVESPQLTRLTIPSAALGPVGELQLSWRISDPVSPRALGLSADPRPLGLFMQRLAAPEHDAVALPRTEPLDGATAMRPA